MSKARWAPPLEGSKRGEIQVPEGNGGSDAVEHTGSNDRSATEFTEDPNGERKSSGEPDGI